MKYFCILGGIALVGFSFVAQGPSNPALKSAISSMQTAKSLTVKFNVTRLPAAPEVFTLAYSKPDRIRIESPTRLIVSDGKTLRDLDKATNVYTEAPASTAASLDVEVAAWATFFEAKAFAEAKAVRTGAKRKIRGVPVTELEITLPGETTTTLYIDDMTGAPRGASVKWPQGNGTEEVLCLAEELTIGAESLSDDLFAFVPPAGAKLYEAPKVEAVPYVKVQTIFDRACVSCHGSSGGLGLSGHASVMAGARGRAVVIPGNAAGSRLVQYVSGARPRMPKNGAPLPAEDVKAISDWVQGGAKN